MNILTKYLLMVDLNSVFCMMNEEIESDSKNRVKSGKEKQINCLHFNCINNISLMYLQVNIDIVYILMCLLINSFWE